MRTKTKARTILGTVVAAGYAAGSSMDELAKLHECSEGTIRNILRDEGVAVRKRGRPKATDKPATQGDDTNVNFQ